MGTSDTRRFNMTANPNLITILIAGGAALLGGYSAVESFVQGHLPFVHRATVLVFLFCAPLILGFYGHSVDESAVTGIVAPTGYGVQLSSPAYSPVDWVAGAVIAAGYSLPIAVVMFIIGAALRRDGIVWDNRRRIALVFVGSLLVALFVAAGISANVLSPGGDQ